jgi:1,4-dihydroxy-2-naphthoate octaprenyltransferase
MVGLHSLQTVYFLINSAILKRIRNNDNNYYDTDHSL